MNEMEFVWFMSIHTYIYIYILRLASFICEGLY